MSIHHLDHVNLRTGQLEHLVAWYGDILGPNFLSRERGFTRKTL